MKLQSNKRHFPQQISDEVQELINYRPSWTVRNATIVFFFIIFCTYRMKVTPLFRRNLSPLFRAMLTP